jgi:hypothetical protein
MAKPELIVAPLTVRGETFVQSVLDINQGWVRTGKEDICLPLPT